MGLRSTTNYTDSDLIKFLLNGKEDRPDLSADEITRKFHWVEILVTDSTKKVVTARVFVGSEDEALDLCYKYGLLRVPTPADSPLGLIVGPSHLSSQHVSDGLVHISVSQVVRW